MIRPLLLGVVGAALCGGLTAGPALASRSAPTVGGAGGDVRLSGAYLGPAEGGYRPLYVRFEDTGTQPDLLEAVIAPQSRSATWVMTHPIHTPAEVSAFAALCGGDPRLLAQADAELAASSDVVLPAHGAVQLRPGVGRIQLNGLEAPAAATPVTFYFASGAVVRLVVPVSAGA